MNIKPCEYCGAPLPEGVNKKTRQQRSAHFAHCMQRPVKPMPTPPGSDVMANLLMRLEDAVNALDGTSIKNEKLVDDYRAWRATQ